MKKPLVAIAAAIAIGLAIAPFAIGLMARDQLTARIAAIDSNNDWVSASVTAYERGWFSSDVQVTFTLDPANAPQLQDLPAGAFMLQSLVTELPVDIDVRHGPISIGDPSGIGFAFVEARPDSNDPDVAALTASLGVPYLFEFRGRSWLGRFDFDADIPPFEHAAPLGTFSFSGFDIEGQGTQEGVDVAGAFDSLEMQGTLAAGAIESVGFDMRYRPDEDGIPLSSGRLSIARAVASSPLMGAAPLFEIAGLSVNQNIEPSADGMTLDGIADYKLAALVTSAGTRFEDVEFSLAATHFDRQAVADYYAAVNAAPGLTGDPDFLVARLIEVTDALARRGFSLDADPIRFSMASGRLDAVISAAVDGGGADPSTLLDLRNIAVLLGVLTVDADIVVTEALARELALFATRQQLAATGQLTGDELDTAAEAQSGLMLAMLVGQGFIVDDGDDYIVRARLVDGELTVNGSPLPFLF